MSKFYYDLHIHSCLSPCADDDNTPNNIAGMAHLSGLDIVALTDHNTSRNCPAFFKAAEKYGIIPIAGMELTTSEDIHLVCLFEKLEDALKFDEEIQKFRVYIKNNVKIFGRQLIMNENDEVIFEDDYLLSNATEISIEDAEKIVKDFGGICYPAHIDRDANGIIAILGTFPEHLPFKHFELRDSSKYDFLSKNHPIDGKLKIVSSDAHFLEDIKDAENYFELDADKNNPYAVRHELFKRLGGFI